MIILQKVFFGPAGYPAEARGSINRVFEFLQELDLDALEYAAVYGLRASEEKAKQIGVLSRESKVTVSMHAAYYINLASKSQDTRERSKERLKKALRFAPLMNVKRIVFHPGTKGGLSDDEAFEVIKSSLQEVWEEAGHLGNGAVLAPEIAGKIKSFGSIDEIIRLCSTLDGVIPTIDWAHLYARSQGEINDKGSFQQVFDKFERELGKVFTKNMHFHISGIEFTKAGERSHKSLGGDWGPDILPLMEIISENGYHPTIISETPTPVRGAVYAKYLLEELEKSK